MPSQKELVAETAPSVTKRSQSASPSSFGCTFSPEGPPYTQRAAAARRLATPRDGSGGIRRSRRRQPARRAFRGVPGGGVAARFAPRHRRADSRGTRSAVRRASGRADGAGVAEQLHGGPPTADDLLAHRGGRRAVPRADPIAAPRRAQHAPERAHAGDVPDGHVPAPRQGPTLRGGVRAGGRAGVARASAGAPQPAFARSGHGDVLAVHGRGAVPVARPAPGPELHRQGHAPAHARARQAGAGAQLDRQRRFARAKRRRRRG